MFNHEPIGYVCPFCLLAQGSQDTYNSQQDIIYQDKLVTAFISPRWWPNNPGNVLIIPSKHFENIYDLPASYAYRIQDIAKEVAIALKEVYKCDGVSTRQHNEPAGGQDVWHYHLHVLPRYQGDNLYRSIANKEFTSLEERIVYSAYPTVSGEKLPPSLGQESGYCRVACAEAIHQVPLASSGIHLAFFRLLEV